MHINININQWTKLFAFSVMLMVPAISSADISGELFRDYNLNGLRDVLEPGVSGVTVTAHSDAGLVATTITDANGDYTLTTGAGTYRVEVIGIPEYLKAGTAIYGTTEALTSVVNNGATNHNVGLHNPGEYCQANPDILVAKFLKEGHNGTNQSESAVVRYQYTDNGTDPDTPLATFSGVGSVYGVAHHSAANVTYLSSYFKRHADIGPAGVSAIYKLDQTSTVVSTFAALPGTDPRGGAGSNPGYDWNHDTDGYAEVGKTGIGDIELSDDESQLFAVNMEDKKLYVYDLDPAGDALSSASYDIPNPCSAAAGTADIDFRPMGLGFQDGILYVGATCTAESTVFPNDPNESTAGPRRGDQSQLSAHVYSFSPALSVFSGTPVLDVPLDYQRGCIYNGDISNAIPPAGCAQIPDHQGIPQPFVASWLPWQMDYDIVFNDKAPGNIGNQNGWLEYMQPLLSDIEFDNNGAMILGIRDINGDRTGYENASPDPADVTVQNGNGEGDILRACGNAQAGWTLETNATCGNITTGGAGRNEGPDGGEYYWYDNGPGGNGSIGGFTQGHSETYTGGLLQVPGHSEIVTGVMDVHDFLDNGLIWLDNSTGEIALDGSGTPKRLLVSPVDSVKFFGKASGMGDLEALCDPAAIEIGNYIWDDLDGDGIQDPSEPALSGVTVELYEAGTLVGTAITGADGQYYFGGSTNLNMSGGAVKSMTAYQLRVPLTGVNTAALGGKLPTQQNTNANADDMRDSDGDNEGLNLGFSTVEHTTGKAGENNHTVDFGFVSPGSWTGNVSVDTTGDGAGDTPLSGVTIELFTDPDGDGDSADGVSVGTTVTDAAGNYSFTDLTPGDYVAVETQPAGYDSVSEDEGGLDDDDNGNAANNNQISGTVDANETDVNNDFVEIELVDISLVKTVSNAAPNVGDTVTFTVTVANAGPSDATGVAVEDTLPAGYSGIANISNGGALAGSLINWTGLAITAGSSVSLTYDAVVEATGPYVNVANVTAQDQPDVDSTPGNNPDTDGDGDIDSDDEDDADDVTTTPINPATGIWTGNVSEDTDNNGSGDTPIPGVEIILYVDTNGDGVLDATETTVAGTTTTDGAGDYSITGLVPGDYIAVQTQPSGFTDVSEDEGGSDDDGNNNPANNNQIAGTIAAGETDSGNDFVEVQSGTISGNVSEDTDGNGTGDTPISGVMLELLDSNGEPVTDAEGNPITAVTDGNGNYVFTGLIPSDNYPIPGGYQVREIQPTGYDSQSDVDGSNDNLIGLGTPIIVTPGGVAPGNDFVEVISAVTPIGVPTLSTWAQMMLTLMLILLSMRYYRRYEES